MAKALEDRVIENAGERPLAGDDIVFVPTGRRVRVMVAGTTIADSRAVMLMLEKKRLAVYYFPAMDDWNRAIVRPLTLKGFERSMRETRASHEKWAPLTPEQEKTFEDNLVLGQAMLNNYFVWAAALDDFDSVFASAVDLLLHPAFKADKLALGPHV